MSSTIQVRVDDELKEKADQLFRELGTDTTTAVRIFLKQAVAYNGFPFEIKRIVQDNPYAPLTEDQLLAKLKRSRTDISEGNIQSADDMISNMRKRYDL